MFFGGQAEGQKGSEAQLGYVENLLGLTTPQPEN